jgi:pimeloyl-ACP methyl ester carboxylesterase
MSSLIASAASTARAVIRRPSGVTAGRPELEARAAPGLQQHRAGRRQFLRPTGSRASPTSSPPQDGRRREEGTDVYKQMSPLDVSEGAPFLFVNGKKDRLSVVPRRHMVEALKKVNVPVEMIVVKNAGHGYVFNAAKGGPPAEPSPAEVDAAVLRFLDANLKK